MKKAVIKHCGGRKTWIPVYFNFKCLQMLNFNQSMSDSDSDKCKNVRSVFLNCFHISCFRFLLHIALHHHIFSRLISRSNGLQFPLTWQTHKQTDWPHNIKIQEWAVYKGLLDRLESCVFISQRIWKKDGEKSALHLSHPKQVNEGSRS